MTQTDIPYTRGLAVFVAGLRYGDVPAEVRERTRLLVLDGLGRALYGADLPCSRILMETLDTLDGTRACAVWGTDRRLGTAHPALVNGTRVQGFERDDVHRQGIRPVGAVPRYEVGPRWGSASGPSTAGRAGTREPR